MHGRFDLLLHSFYNFEFMTLKEFKSNQISRTIARVSSNTVGRDEDYARAHGEGRHIVNTFVIAVHPSK